MTPYIDATWRLEWEATVVLDTETTGLHYDNGARVVEVGAVLLWLHRATAAAFEVASFEMTCHPGEAALAHPAATAGLAVSGLSAQELRRQPSDARVASMLKFWLTAHGAAVLPVAAFNVAFDSSFLARAPWMLGTVYAPDLMLHAAQTFGGPGRRRIALAAAAAAAGVASPPGRAHRALFDARVAAGIASALYARGAWSPGEPVLEPGVYGLVQPDMPTYE